jgi:hypothetical protein
MTKVQSITKECWVSYLKSARADYEKQYRPS